MPECIEATDGSLRGTTGQVRVGPGLSTLAVDHLSFSVRPGMVTGFLGLAALDHIVWHELTPRSASLEEAFMELTRDSVDYRTDATVGIAS